MTASPDEPGHVEFPQATWTSFDRYGRYGAIVGALRACLGDGPARVLDVGDSAGHLHLFDPGLEVVGLDVELAAEPLPGARRLQGDGTHLPFPDRAFDAVVSSDVLEHVAPDGRAAFLAELGRVSRDVVVVAAPFDTAGVAGCEELARRYALVSAGAAQPQLEEHRDHGLPALGATVAALEASGASAVTAGNGNLWDWLLMMVLRFQLEARPELRALGDGYDLWYNAALAGRAHVGPFYRHVVVSHAGGEPRLGPPWAELGALGAEPGADGGGGPPVELAAVLAALVAADTSEVVRHDARQAERRLDELGQQAVRLGRQLDHLGERLEALIELEVSMAEQIRGVLRPFYRAARPFRRGSSS